MQLTEFMKKLSDQTCQHKQKNRPLWESTYYELVFLVIYLYLLALLLVFYDGVGVN